MVGCLVSTCWLAVRCILQSDCCRMRRTSHCWALFSPEKICFRLPSKWVNCFPSVPRLWVPLWIDSDPCVSFLDSRGLPAFGSRERMAKANRTVYQRGWPVAYMDKSRASECPTVGLLKIHLGRFLTLPIPLNICDKSGKVR